MLLTILFLTTFSLFAGIILLFSRTAKDDQRLAARFASIRSLSVAELASGKTNDLLKAVQDTEPNLLERLLARFSLGAKFQRLVLQAESTTTARKLLVTCLLSASVTALLTLFFLPNRFAVLAGTALGAYIPLFLLLRRRNKRIGAFNKALPDSIEMMSRSLRAGYSLVAALGVVAEGAAEPAKSEFAEVFRKQNFGLPLRDCLFQLLDRVPSPDLRVFVTGVLVQKDTGGNLAEILDRITAVIRERLKIQGEIRTHTAQGRMTGWILCALPIVMLLAINWINPGYSKPLTETPLGRKLLYTGIGLLAFGAFLIRNIIRSVEV